MAGGAVLVAVADLGQGGEEKEPADPDGDSGGVAQFLPFPAVQAPEASATVRTVIHGRFISGILPGIHAMPAVLRNRVGRMN